MVACVAYAVPMALVFTLSGYAVGEALPAAYPQPRFGSRSGDISWRKRSLNPTASR